MYVPMTDEMLAVFEEGRCSWSITMQKLMWLDRAHYKAVAEKARAEYDVLQARHAALVEACAGAANHICGCGDWLPEYIRQPMLAALRDAGVDVVDEAKEAVDGNG